MSGVQPVGLYTIQVPPGGIMVPALPHGAVAMFRVSMAAIDPDAEPEYEDDAAASKPARSTLKIVHMPDDLDFDDEDDEDWEDHGSEEDSDDEEINGGPSDKAKAKKRQAEAALMDLDAEDEDDEDNTDFKAALSQLIKGKGPATGDEDEDDDDEEGLELEETVVCTLDTERQYQQPLDITIAGDERVLFKVTGTHTVYLTGNFVLPAEEGHHHDDEEEDDDDDEEDDDDYDLSPDEDELDGMDFLLNGDEESDDLDDLEDPRITEIDSEKEEAEKAPKLVTKGKNKRAAEDEAALDDLIAKESASKGDSKKQQKKLKKNNGDAVPVESKKDAKEAPAAKADKKVQFAKNLEQGPTPSSNQKPAEKSTGTLGVKEVQGVKIDDKKLGKGPAAKSGNTVAMRYIGKLEDGKVFDSNKKGKPFTFKLGKGEVIKGWDIGIAGMTAGGERRITIPSHLAYGKKALPGIPANSKLIFDVKLLEIK
ncbi:FKBP-type peptidyl-prolyl isomerase, putative [Talaromyces stipitatus ATCC 10500]|uniref:FK506-binding protein n=1 Tax=Talaromyces stipitatus (strain ATCC 10500 / CBS 375.48 / QM 6759 / NRRL 1006) TaxID=441959 RepID=B8LYS4_TALSN|nr:FKBP-type peptidyl-prolyl isomerase, putative [Talaromyces stipitatus ATCC 10500]EED23432.1 FKBP-type peptidyl-prolyl isomerase, putative [Talaromyces stipitatus ATCC 10500]